MDEDRNKANEFYSLYIFVKKKEIYRNTIYGASSFLITLAALFISDDYIGVAEFFGVDVLVFYLIGFTLLFFDLLLLIAIVDYNKSIISVINKRS